MSTEVKVYYGNNQFISATKDNVLMGENPVELVMKKHYDASQAQIAELKENLRELELDRNTHQEAAQGLSDIISDWRDRYLAERDKVTSLEAQLSQADKVIQRLSVSGDGTHGDKRASFYDCLPTLQIEFDERISFARQYLSQYKQQSQKGQGDGQS